MSFPVVFHLGPLALPAHLVFETLAYIVGYRLYVWLRRTTRDTLDDQSRLTVLIGAAVGAGLGSKLLGFAEHPDLWPQAFVNPGNLIAAKSILGALLGGIIGVEIAKATAGITRSTGDIYVFPLLVAMAIGRIGCFLTGVSDGTWGSATRLPVGMFAGDAVLRHPTPLYEIVFLLVFGAVLLMIRRWRRLHNGDLFKLFIIGYCAWRFGVEFLKPVTTYAFVHGHIAQHVAAPDALNAAPGLSILQICALAGAMVYITMLVGRSIMGGTAHGRA